MNIKLLPYIAFHIIIGSFVLLSSCANKVEDVLALNKPTSPDQVFKDSKAIRSIQGVVEVQIESPLIYNYEGENGRIEYPKGLFVKFFNPDKSIKSTLSAKYAINNTSTRTMEARNNIIIIDYKSGDTTYTESLIWDQAKERIYSNKALKRVNGDNVTFGDGFEANERLDSIIIKNQRGTFDWKDEE